MENRHLLTLKTPAAWHRDMWREALPIGNGITGALIFGNIADETILINHCKLWHWGKKSELPDISYTLNKTREMIDNGDFWNANWVSANALKESGYETKLSTPLPLCAIKLDMGERSMFTHYRRRLNMMTGEAIVSWHEDGAEFERKAFMSRADDTFVYKVTGGSACRIYIDMYDTYEPDTKRFKDEAGDSLEIFCEDNFLFYAFRNEDGTDFGAVMKVDAGKSPIKIKNGNKLLIEDAPQFTAYVKFFVQGERKSQWEVLKNELLELNTTYEECIERHAKLHSPLYESVDITLSNDEDDKSNEELLLDAYEEKASNVLLEKLWRFGRYLMVSGTREGGMPFSLYGLWAGRYSLPWPHNMANENLQMIYWHTETGGLIDLMKPVINYYYGLINDFKKNARLIFGLDGIYVPAGTTPGTGLPNQIVPVIMNWIGAMGWLSRHFYQYYKYTRDEKYFNDVIFPFMYEAAKFYTAYIVKDEKGLYKIYPSVSPENTPKNLMPSEEHEHMAHPCPSVVNATMDIAIIKELLSNMITESGKHNISHAEITKWQDIVDNLPSYEKTADGNIREWIYPNLTERYTHRHLSHIYPVFPGNEHIKGRDGDIIDAFELAVDKRILGSQSGWSLAHMSCIYARFERAEKAVRCLDILSRSCLTNNFFSLHNDWRSMGLTLGRGPFAPVQLDAGMGVVNALQEMLFFNSDDILKYLPACPERFSKGSVTGFRFIGGRTDFSWDMNKKEFFCCIETETDIKLRIQLPDFLSDYSLKTDNGTYPVERIFELTLPACSKAELKA